MDLVRHYTLLSRMNFGVDVGTYPLGSCTMKYNPKFTEQAARLPGFAGLHPLLPQLRRGGLLAQGALRVIHELEDLLKQITGMDAFTMQPLAGAHGELTGIMLMAAYHNDKGNQKSLVLVPDSAHGTNPASAAIAGYEVVTVPSKGGVMDPVAFKEMLNDQVAGVMMTNPNTVGLFNPYIAEIAEAAHQADALMYYDGANLNAIMGMAKPADLGFDIVHLNLHKTFATPTAAADRGPVRWAWWSASGTTCPYPGWRCAPTAPCSSTTTTPSPLATWLPSTATSGCASRPLPTSWPWAARGSRR